MSQTPHSPPPAAAGDQAGEPVDTAGEGGPAGEADALDRMREQLLSISAGDVVAEAAMSLLTLAYARLGLPPEQHAAYRDLAAARLLIDALGGMLDGVRGRIGRIEPDLRDALAGVRMAYVSVAEHAAGGGEAVAEEAPSGTGPEAARPEAPTEPVARPAPGQEPAGEPGRRPRSGLWVPGEPL